MNRCLLCYNELRPGEIDFHPACSRKFFGTSQPPVLDYGRADMERLAGQIVRAQTTLTGVQPKLSLHLDRPGQRLTLVGLWGDFIFKPQTEDFAELPENEDLTLHLAEAARLRTVPHTLIRLADGSLGYLTRRIDRTAGGGKIPMEDMCQLTGRPTEYKYQGSYEQIGKVIRACSSVPQLDVADYFETVLFSWLTGNNDMHLKNFSLYSPAPEAIRLSPAYDLLNAAVANPGDPEEMALTLNGRKRRIGRADFLTAAATCGLPGNLVPRLCDKFRRLRPQWEAMIRRSFLSGAAQEAYIALLENRFRRLTDE